MKKTDLRIGSVSLLCHNFYIVIYTQIQLYLTFILYTCGGVRGRVVNTSNSESGGKRFKPCLLLYSTLSLHLGVKMDTGDILLRPGNPAMD